MKLTMVLLLVALVSYGCSPSAACELLQNFTQELVFGSEKQYLKFISHYSRFLPAFPPVRTTAIEFKECAESLSPEMKQAIVAVTENIIVQCEKSE